MVLVLPKRYPQIWLLHLKKQVVPYIHYTFPLNPSMCTACEVIGGFSNIFKKWSGTQIVSMLWSTHPTQMQITSYDVDDVLLRQTILQ